MRKRTLHLCRRKNNKMPYSICKKRGRNCYSVVNRKNGRVLSRCTSREKAIKQDRLLRALLYNKTFRTNRS